MNTEYYWQEILTTITLLGALLLVILDSKQEIYTLGEEWDFITPNSKR